MEDDVNELKEYIWDLTKAIAELFRNALHERDREAAKYFAGELQRVGEEFFAQSGADKKLAAGLSGPPALAVAISESRKAMGEKEHSVKGRKVRSHLPLSETEIKVLALILLSDNPPTDLEHLAGSVYPEHAASNDPTIRMGARGRCSKAITLGFSKVRRILQSGAINDSESNFLKRLQDKIPHDASANPMEYLDQQIAAKYLKTKIEMCLKCGEYPIHVKKRGLCRFCAKQFYDSHRNDSSPERAGKIENELKLSPFIQTVQDGSKDWIKLLYAAFFHPDGPSLDQKVLSKRTRISLDMVPAVLGGALDALRDHWDNGEENEDKEAVIFIQMVKEQWPNQSFDKVLENVKLDGAEDSSA